MELLALHQPAASDLRFLTTAMKIVTDLERIGDQAVNIAERALELNQEPQLKPYIDLPRMAEMAQAMVKGSLDAFVARDTALARRVRAEDGAVDDLNHQIFRELLTFMMADPVDDPARDPADPDRALPRAGRRPRDQHRRDGGLPGREPDGAAHHRLIPAPGPHEAASCRATVADPPCHAVV